MTWLDYLQKAARSKTIWTLVLMVLMVSIPDLKDLFSPVWYKAIMDVLALLAGYFKLNPSQSY